MKKKTGEVNSELYADENGIRIEFHPLLNGVKRPDYLAYTIGGPILAHEFRQ